MLVKGRGLEPDLSTHTDSLAGESAALHPKDAFWIVWKAT